MSLSRAVQVAAIAAVAALVVAVPESLGHSRSESYSIWSVAPDRASASITVSTGEVAALMTAAEPQPLARLFGEHASETITLYSEGRACTTGDWRELAAARGFLRVEIDFDCAGSAADELQYRALFDALPAHVHYLRWFEGGESRGEGVITERADRWQREEGVGHSFTAFLALGFEHILGGIDHIAFLAGLLLVAGSAGRSVLAVTGFTLGHSASLAAAVTGFVTADGRLIEAFIGFTVALVATEYFLRGNGRSAALAAAALIASAGIGLGAVAAGAIGLPGLVTYVGFGIFAAAYLALSKRLGARRDGRTAAALFLLTAAFGVIHGFGFAGFLLETGIEGRSLVVPLAGFNLGVEAGQLALVAVALAGGALLGRTAARRMAPAVAAGLCAVGVFWFVERSLGA